jgi:hypothetical protein
MQTRLPCAVLLCVSSLSLISGCFSDGTQGTNNVAVVTPSVSGTITAVVGAGTRPVAFSFNSDDSHTLSNLAVTAGLSSLPAGWSGPSDFQCPRVSTGNGCVLNLTYAPQRAESGSLTLDYGYVDNAGQRTTAKIFLLYASTTNNNVVLTAAPSGQIDAVAGVGGQPVVLTFTSDDGNPASQLTMDLATLPAGWTGPSSSFACSSVSTGNGCQLSLTYTPTAAAAAGAVSLHYDYLDDSGATKTGAVNIPYAATTHDHVTGSASPSGQINAVVGTGAQAVTVTFNTDDGNVASRLSMTSGLASLPAGWTGPSGLSCTTVSTGGACQLQLSYAPPAIGSGTLNLGYAYTDNAGASQTGTVSIPYASTTNDNVVGTPSLSGTLGVQVGGSQAITVTFTTDDGNTASQLAMDLSALPAGWSSSPSNSFACANVNTGNDCQLSLLYAPTSAAMGTLMLSFSYISNSGATKSGSVSLPYLASVHHLYIADLTDVFYCTLNGDGTLSGCAVTGSGIAEPQGIAVDGDRVYVADYANNTIFLCAIATDGSLANCASTGSNFNYPQNIAIQGGRLYVTNGLNTATPTICTIANDGTLTGCVATSGLSGTDGVAATSSYAYLSVPGSNAVYVCAVANDGTLSGCAATGSGFSNDTGVTLSGAYAYITDRDNGLVDVCSVNANGTLSSCSGSAVSPVPEYVLIAGSRAYVADHYDHIYLCSVGTNGGLSGCAVSDGGGSFNVPLQLAMH